MEHGRAKNCMRNSTFGHEKNAFGHGKGAFGAWKGHTGNFEQGLGAMGQPKFSKPYAMFDFRSAQCWK